MREIERLREKRERMRMREKRERERMSERERFQIYFVFYVSASIQLRPGSKFKVHKQEREKKFFDTLNALKIGIGNIVQVDRLESLSLSPSINTPQLTLISKKVFSRVE